MVLSRSVGRSIVAYARLLKFTYIFFSFVRLFFCSFVWTHNVPLSQLAYQNPNYTIILCASYSVFILKLRFLELHVPIVSVCASKCLPEHTNTMEHSYLLRRRLCAVGGAFQTFAFLVFVCMWVYLVLWFIL